MGEAPDAHIPFRDLMPEEKRGQKTEKQDKSSRWMAAFVMLGKMHYAPEDGAPSTAAMTALTRSGESDDLAA